MPFGQVGGLTIINYLRFLIQSALKRVHFIVILTLFAGFFGSSLSTLKAQHLSDTIGLRLITPAGGFEENSGVYMAWSIGEVMIATEGDHRYFMTQGFHQTAWTVVKVWNYQPEIDVDMKVYPNPVVRELTLEMDFTPEWDSPWMCVMQDYAYRPVLEQEITSSKTSLYVAHLSNGPYMLSVYNDQRQLVKTIRLIKNE
ncbi:hypothetical protein KFE98_15885 [bacterium SCSIO 12741]|nr:hypothetical protein KFE98_15885 [bacterium SCSIO 12741]